jgi:hypothetical protein
MFVEVVEHEDDVDDFDRKGEGVGGVNMSDEGIGVLYIVMQEVNTGYGATGAALDSPLCLS